jgi:DNA-binding NtrC family response regulator
MFSEKHVDLSNILVVDDEENTRLGLRLLLQGEGYTVRTAEHGLAALQALHYYPSDLVLTDLDMPQMNGFEFLEIVRQDFPHVRVIIMSSLGSMPTYLDVHSSGVCGFLHKPVTLEALRKAIDKSLTDNVVTGEL